MVRRVGVSSLLLRAMMMLFLYDTFVTDKKVTDLLRGVEKWANVGEVKACNWQPVPYEPNDVHLVADILKTSLVRL